MVGKPVLACALPLPGTQPQLPGPASGGATQGKGKQMASSSSGTPTGGAHFAGAARGMRKRRHGLLAVLSLLLVIAAAVPAAAQADLPPVLSVGGETGETLRWTASGKHNTYKLRVRVIGGEASISTVIARTITPVPVPGATVFYRVKAAYNESRWSDAVAITYQGGEPPIEEEEEPPIEEEPPNEEAAGEVKYRLDAKSYFDPFASNTTFLHKHIDRILGYEPFADTYVAAGIPTLSYHDAYTTWGPGNLNPTHRAEYVKWVEQDKAAGYLGQFMDDVEWSGSGQHIAGSDEEMAKLIEAVRKTLGPTGVLELNTQYADLWPRIKAGDPYVARALAVTDQVDKEFGVNSSSGIDTASEYAEYMRYVDALHAKGIHIDQADSTPGNEYELATYLLVNDGADFTGAHLTPSEWWSGYDANLGDALGARERSASGLWKRRFTGGVVYTVEPGGATQTIRLGKLMHSAEWGDVETVTLKAREGAVLEG
jgi:hypothetical protein